MDCHIFNHLEEKPSNDISKSRVAPNQIRRKVELTGIIQPVIVLSKGDIYEGIFCIGF